MCRILQIFLPSCVRYLKYFLPVIESNNLCWTDKGEVKGVEEENHILPSIVGEADLNQNLSEKITRADFTLRLKKMAAWTDKADLHSRCIIFQGFEMQGGINTHNNAILKEFVFTSLNSPLTTFQIFFYLFKLSVDNSSALELWGLHLWLQHRHGGLG